MKKVYLAGANTGRSAAECLNWRIAAQKMFTERFGIEALIPFDGHDLGGQSDAEVILKDMKMLSDCQGVLVDCNQPSWGTAMEVYFASNLAKERPMITGWVDDQRLELSPWLKFHVKPIHFSLEAAVTYLGKGLKDAF